VFFITDSGDVLTAAVGPKFVIGLTKGDRWCLLKKYWLLFPILQLVF
jgi:hypothetical protein